MRIVTIGILLFAAMFPAKAEELLAPEALLPGYEQTDAHMPSIACGKGLYLAVWQVGVNEKADIVGLRIDRSGKALDAKPFVICAARDCQEQPRVAFAPSTSSTSSGQAGPGQGGGVFLVVWQDLRNSRDWDIYAARVSSDGKLLDPDGIAVVTGDRNQSAPEVCFAAGSFQVLWRAFIGDGALPMKQKEWGAKSEYQIWGGRVSVEGKPLDGPGVAVIAMGNNGKLGSPSAVALGDGRILVGSVHHTGTWDLGISLKLVLAGKPVDAVAGLKNVCQNDQLALASDGKSASLAWSTFVERGGRGGHIPESGMSLVSLSEGIKPQVVKSLYSPSSARENKKCGSRPTLAWDGKTYVAAWQVIMAAEKLRYDRIMMRRVSATGEPDAVDVIVAGEPDSPAICPAVASDGAGTTVVVYERHPKTGDTPIKIAVRVMK
ncbi:MAG: hypothetical protein C0404_07965 [Verrucomicrobia bacterium]|nr:hypothetical protein [Verrucomicrobiota bacterium]